MQIINNYALLQPSKTKLAEVTFIDRVEDLPDPVTMASHLPERRKLLEVKYYDLFFLIAVIYVKVLPYREHSPVV